MPPPNYLHRIVDGPLVDGPLVDGLLGELLGGLTAIAIEGPKGVGKTRTARRRAASFFDLSDPSTLELVKGDPARLTAVACVISAGLPKKSAPTCSMPWW